MAEAEKLARMFRVFSVDTRIKIVQLLRGRALCVNALSHHLGVTPAAVSQHLRVLRDAGVVVPKKRGYFVHYRLNDKTLLRWGKMTVRLLERERTEKRKGNE
ncbi:MAG: metalloregulator ArsR/SmtB family transcription factor [bacterium]